ncbi:MAG: PLP-dependent aminotransferase family protein [Pseudomonadota bacterium]
MNAPYELPAAALSRAAGVTLAEQLAARYAERIRQRLLMPGTRLPSVRECARRHAVSPTTVVAAYDQLLAQGLVEARRQRGFFVREPRAGEAARAPTPAAVSHRPPPVDATALIRGMFQGGDKPAPGMGTLPAEWLDLPLLHTALRRAMAAEAGSMSAPGRGAASLQYGDPAGDRALREVLAHRLADIGVACTAHQMVTTLGATHGLDIVSRTLLQPGDAVLVDEPGWAVEYARLTRLGMRLLPVPRGPQGPDLQVMRALLQAHRPRLYATVSVLHNPTGCSLPLAAAHQVLKLAEAHDLLIVEDDTYAHLAPAHAPRLAALDGLQRTIYISGFSKILAPNWRVGFIAASPQLTERFIDMKLLSALTTPALPEQAIAWCIAQGALRRHTERVNAQLDAARARAQALALEAGCRFVTPPQGLFGWVDVATDTERLAQRMLDDGWLLAPGTLFHPTPRPSTLMRINFATSQDARFWQALKKACAN